MKHLPIKALIVSGTLVIISFCLTYFRIILPLNSIVHPCYLIPIVCIGHMYGCKYGLFAGIILGILQTVQNGIGELPGHVILFTLLTYTVFIVSGLFSSKKFGLLLGYTLSILLFYAATVILHITNPPAGWEASGLTPVNYALMHNLYSILIDGIISIIVLLIPSVRKFIDNTRSVTLEE